MPLGKRCGVDLDNALGYEVPRKVFIKDGCIGLAYWATVIGCGVALLVQIFAISKGHYKTGQVGGALRVQAQGPKVEWTSQELGQRLPYCLDSSVNTPAFQNTSDYVVFDRGVGANQKFYYQYRDSVVSERYACQYLDEKWEVANPLEPNSAFFPTRYITYKETAPSCKTAPNSRTTINECTYAPAGLKTRWYVPDVEAFTLWIVHGISVPSIASSWTKDQMVSGQLLDQSGKPVDVCAFYRRRNPAAPCPLNPDMPEANMTHYVSIGVKNVPDIVPIGSLLEAAGINSLDETNFLTDSYRYGGVTLVVQLNYNNYGGLTYDSWKDVKYTMTVEAVRGKVKGVFATPDDAVQWPSTSRTVFERSGLRIIFTFSGTMGKPDFFSGFVAVFTIANALTWAAVAMGLFISKCLTFSPVYKAYITTKTLDLPAGADKRLANEINTLFTEHGVVRARARAGVGGGCARGAAFTTLPPTPFSQPPRRTLYCHASPLCSMRPRRQR
jgi:hypothetical protein